MQCPKHGTAWTRASLPDVCNRDLGFYEPPMQQYKIDVRETKQLLVAQSHTAYGKGTDMPSPHQAKVWKHLLGRSLPSCAVDGLLDDTRGAAVAQRRETTAISVMPESQA